MADAPTEDQVIEAARSLGDEFTRAQVAEKLGVEPSEMRQSWKAIKQSGRIEKTRSDEEGTNHFKVAA
jgi:hypothetical protein